jgi:hypothetical protein
VTVARLLAGHGPLGVHVDDDLVQVEVIIVDAELAELSVVDV